MKRASSEKQAVTDRAVSPTFSVGDHVTITEGDGVIERLFLWGPGSTLTSMLVLVPKTKLSYQCLVANVSPKSTTKATTKEEAPLKQRRRRSVRGDVAVPIEIAAAPEVAESGDPSKPEKPGSPMTLFELPEKRRIPTTVRIRNE
jgi:hypothetical protein